VRHRPSPELRRYPRKRVSLPVVVETDNRTFYVRTVNLGPRGAKVRLAEPLAGGTEAQLHFHPENGPQLHVQAIAWRADLDGMAFFFIGPGSPRGAAGRYSDLAEAAR
jgi:hypothetical protein